MPRNPSARRRNPRPPGPAWGLAWPTAPGLRCPPAASSRARAIARKTSAPVKPPSHARSRSKGCRTIGYQKRAIPPGRTSPRVAISVRQNDSQSARGCPMRRRIGQRGHALDREGSRRVASVARGGAHLDQFPQQRQAGTAQGKGLVQFQIAAGGDLLGHCRQSFGAELPPYEAVRAGRKRIGHFLIRWGNNIPSRLAPTRVYFGLYSMARESHPPAGVVCELGFGARQLPDFPVGRTLVRLDGLRSILQVIRDHVLIALLPLEPCSRVIHGVPQG